MTKPTGDFIDVDMQAGWETPAGYVGSMQRKVLSGALDEEAGAGRRTLPLRVAPGTASANAHAHEYVEEALILEGDLTWIDGNGGVVQELGPYSYVCRAPRRMHGPFRTEAGCLVLEICYFPGY